MTMILPVIHYADANQAMRNAERAMEAGCAGVMLIEMQGMNLGLHFAGAAIKRRWPEAHIGINWLGVRPADAVMNSVDTGVDSTWTDEQLTHSEGTGLVDSARVRSVIAVAPPHAVFCAVAFKYQQHEPLPALAASRAVAMGFIPTTSGPATGVETDPHALAALRLAIGPDAPLAIASGITPDNARFYLPSVTHILVSTGVSASFHEFDPARLRALAEAAA